jgi:xanthine dehydrogenase accessory factor
MVIVATQGHGDEDAVEQAVTTRPAYLGLVGSRRRGAAVLGYLAERGLPTDQLDRVHVPAGLDLGHTTHQEIAVAILAELVQLRASGALAGAGAKRGGGENRAGAGAKRGGGENRAGAAPGAAAGPGAAIPSSAAAEAGAQAGGPVTTGNIAQDGQPTDPVCGMTVTAGPGAYPLAHDGVTYYFCCPGCRSQFERDPAAYAKKETRC